MNEHLSMPPTCLPDSDSAKGPTWAPTAPNVLRGSPLTAQIVSELRTHRAPDAKVFRRRSAPSVCIQLGEGHVGHGVFGAKLEAKIVGILNRSVGVGN